jgi:hypothetical protein
MNDSAPRDNRAIVPHADYLASDWDSVKSTVTNRTNTTIFAPDWGGISAIAWLDTGIFGVQIIPDFVFLLDEFTNNGYVVGKDLFGAPFDWRHAPLYIDFFYRRFKDLIEHAYTTNDNTPVAIFAYSAGGMVTYRFLTQYVDQAWKDKYINRVVWGSSSFGGSMSATKIAWDHKYDFIPDSLMSDSLFRFFTQSPVLFAHFPNWHVTPDQVVLRGPDGNGRTAKDIPQFLKERGKLTSVGQLEADQAQAVFARPLEFPGVNSYFIFNSGIPTLQTLQWNTSYDDPYTEINGWGDTTLLKDTLYFGCNNWPVDAKNKTIVCRDFDINSIGYSHILMLAQQDFIDAAWDAMTSDQWLIPGQYNITTGPAARGNSRRPRQ